MPPPSDDQRTQAIVDVLREWHRSLAQRDAYPLPAGLLTQISRRAREILYQERVVLEGWAPPPADDTGRPAVAASARLRPAEVEWFADLVEHIYQEVGPQRTARIQRIMDGLTSASKSLLVDLAGEVAPSIPNPHPSEVERRVADWLQRLRDRVRHRAENPDEDRVLDELVEKLRLCVRADLILTSAVAPEWQRVADTNTEVRAAWQCCSFEDVPPAETVGPLHKQIQPGSELPPENAGRTAQYNLGLLLDPSGQRSARPLPDDLRDAVGTPDEGARLADVIRREIRRAAFPGGLADFQRRALWFQAVLLVDSRWGVTRVESAVDAVRTIVDPQAAIRHIDGYHPPPAAFDRMRCAAAVQSVEACLDDVTPVDDGWADQLATIVFEPMRAARFAVPYKVAKKSAQLSTCGSEVVDLFGRDCADRARRFGDAGLEWLVERTATNCRRCMLQRLLKEDQGAGSELQVQTIAEWNKTTKFHLGREASSAVTQYEVRRPARQEVAALRRRSVRSRKLTSTTVTAPDDDPLQTLLQASRRRDAVTRTGVDLFVILMAAPGAGPAIDRLAQIWRRVAGPDITRKMRYRLRDLGEFGRWHTDAAQGPTAGHEQAGTLPLRGRKTPLRQEFHRFVQSVREQCPSDQRPSEQRPSAKATRRAEERSSKALYDAVTRMILDIESSLDEAVADGG